MSLIKFSNTRKPQFAPAFNDLFESVFNDSSISGRLMSRVPAVNISETKDKYYIDLAAPGLTKEDFKIELNKNLLTISVDPKVEDKVEPKRYSRREFSYSSFSRSFALPESADDSGIDAEYLQGVLSIHVAKKEQAKPVSRKIEIK